MEQKFDGKIWTQCIRLASTAFNEVNALIESLDELLEEEFSDTSEAHLPKLVVDWEDGTGWDDSEWIYVNYASYYPLKAKGPGNKRASSYLGYQISLDGEGMAASGNHEPLLHLFVMNEEPEVVDGLAITFDIGAEDNIEYVPHKDEYLMCKGGEHSAAWTRQDWFFSLRLAGLESVDDLKQFAVKPVMDLLAGKSPETIWKDGFPPCLVCYRLNEKGQPEVIG